MQHAFSTPRPPRLYVQIGAGDVRLTTGDLDQTLVEVAGQDADQVAVEQRDDTISVIGPRRTGFFRGGSDLDVVVTLPHDSELVTRLGSADVVASGRLRQVRLETGSGDTELDEVTSEASVKTGSGGVRVRTVGGPAVVKTGSGDVEIGDLHGPARLSTGSGDITVRATSSPVDAKSGSGSIEIREAAADASLSTASGDLRVGRFPAGRLSAKNVTGDIRVGIPAGVPVWTDVSSATGAVRSSLLGAGEPADGQDYVELRASTVSGDVLLEQV
jgi:hypothetical protein